MVNTKYMYNVQCTIYNVLSFSFMTEALMSKRRKKITEKQARKITK